MDYDYIVKNPFRRITTDRSDSKKMEALSVEDEGEGISFNVFVYNKQPGVEIDYATGESHLAEK